MAWKTVLMKDVQASKRWAMNGGPFGSNLVQKDYVEYGIPVIRGCNLTSDGYFNSDDFVFVSEEKADKLLANNAHPGDIIITQRGTLGQVGIIPVTCLHERYVISQSQMKLTVNSNLVEAKFVYYYFKSPATIKHIFNHAFSSGVPHINLDILRNIEIPLPPLPTQRKIGAILSAYDDLIENNRRRIAILEEMARMIYREWFVNFRFPGHETTSFVDSPLGLVPEGWKVANLTDLVKVQHGYTESATKEPIGSRFLRGMDINKQSFIDWNSVPYCPITDADRKKYQLVIGDVVVIRMADPGKIGIIEKDVDAVFASYLVRLRNLTPKLTPYYLFYFLLSDRYQGYITGASSGTTRQSVAGGVITGIDLALPPRALLDEFERQISDVRKMLNNLLDKNANLRITRDLLLPKLISGELDVSELDIIGADNA